MNLSIVIPAFNEEKLIGQTLQVIQEAASVFREAGWAWELIVCDNNSNDRTAEIARKAGAQVVFEPENQIARARNTGAAAAHGDWLLFVDADSLPSRLLLQDMIAVISSGRTLAGGATLRLDTDARLPSLIVRSWNRVSRWRRFVAGSFIFVETAAFRAIGGFSLELYASEEIDLSKRLAQLAKQRGREITILHRHPLLTSARKMHLYTRGEHLIFLLRTALVGGRNLRRREACSTWYDGRR